jgi:hypothetical protein
MNFKRKFGLGQRVIWVTDDWKVFYGWCLRHLGSLQIKPSDNVQGRCVGNMVWVRNIYNVAYLTHELIHAVDGIMEDYGISNDSEVRAYAVADMLEFIWKKLGKEKK